MMARVSRAVLLLGLGLAAGCKAPGSELDGLRDAGRDAAVALDAGDGADASTSDDATVAPDASAQADASTGLDASARDASSAPDASAPDAGGGSCSSATVTPPTRCSLANFVPDSPTEPWLGAASGLTAAGTPKHRCIDFVSRPGEEVTLIGKFAYGLLDVDLSGEHVEVWLQDPSTCAWTKLGTELTSHNGEHGTVNGVADDGGRVFYTVTGAQLPPAGEYAVKMLVKGDHTAADCNLFVWPEGTHVVVSDIDGTITTRESDGFTTFFDPSSPTPHPAAPEAFQAWASKDYRIIYLTARPEMFTNGTREWFASHGFPFGVMHLSQSNFGELGNAATEYKASYLEALVGDQHVVLDAAYGNKDTDLAAYLRAGVPAPEVSLFAYDGDLMGAVRIDDYAPEAARVSCLPVVAQP